MQFDIITIFPAIFDSFLEESIINKALEKSLIKVHIHNLRDFTVDRHQIVDDKPFGGGIGMVLKIEPIFKAVQFCKKQKYENKKTRVVLFTPRGKKFNQKMAAEFSQLDQLIMICGRYEGIDERVAKHIADQNITIGNFVLMGGEVAAMAVVEAVSRLIPKVLGKPQLLKERITKKKGFIEYPQYTRPPEFFPGKFWRARPENFRKVKVWRVPKVLLSGHHKKIKEWRKKHSKTILS